VTEKWILSVPGRKPIKHDGFKILLNKSERNHPWLRCCHGVQQILDNVRVGHDALLVEDDIMLCPDFEHRLGCVEKFFGSNTPALVCFYVPVDIGLPVMQNPMPYPADTSPWGTQANWINADAIPIYRGIAETYLACEVSEEPRDYRTGPHPVGKGIGVYDGWDVLLYKTLAHLNVPVYYYAGVQHMNAKTTCLSTHHTSPFWPQPKDLKNRPGWH